MDSLYGRAKGHPASVRRAHCQATGKPGRLFTRRRGARDQQWSRAMGPLNWQHRPDPEYHRLVPGHARSERGLRVDRPAQTAVDRRAIALAQRFPRWVTFQSGGEIDLVSIPWAWWGRSRQPDEEIRFVYDVIRPSAVDRESPGHAILTVQDTRWFGLLEFLASGQLQQADHIVGSILPREDPESALYGKAKGPLIAVAGAIVLIAARRDECDAAVGSLAREPERVVSWHSRWTDSARLPPRGRRRAISTSCGMAYASSAHGHRPWHSILLCLHPHAGARRSRRLAMRYPKRIKIDVTSPRCRPASIPIRPLP